MRGVERPLQTIRTDVAIIGGGAAGCYAALCLRKQGIKPLIICKGLVGKSGASLFAGNLVVSGKLLGNSDEQRARAKAAARVAAAGSGILDEVLVRVAPFIDALAPAEQRGEPPGTRRIRQGALQAAENAGP